MGLYQQANLFPTSIEARQNDLELEDSLRKIGCLRPVFSWNNQLIDGERRLKIAKRVDVEVEVRTFAYRIDAARALYQIHPRRAFLRFAHVGITRRDLAHLFGVKPHTLPTYHQLRMALKPKQGGVRFYRDKAFIGGIPIERDKLERAKAACRERGISFSAWVREAIERDLLHE